jgi:cardiolipin synthase
MVDARGADSASELIDSDTIAQTGTTALRVVASVPETAGLLPVNELVAALAKTRLWLTDAYFVGSTAYVQALRAAAKDGVDVRLLVPNATDIPLLKPLSRAGYRPLLQAGVRVFEWNGPMIHAKTSVADGRWARVGSTNLNIVARSRRPSCRSDRPPGLDNASAGRSPPRYRQWSP